MSKWRLKMKIPQLVLKESNCLSKILKTPYKASPFIWSWNWMVSRQSHQKWSHKDILVPEKHGQPIKIKRGNQDFSLEARKRGKRAALFRVPDRQRALVWNIIPACCSNYSSLVEGFYKALNQIWWPMRKVEKSWELRINVRWKK